jgi:hypothetical protein
MSTLKYGKIAAKLKYSKKRGTKVQKCYEGVNVRRF